MKTFIRILVITLLAALPIGTAGATDVKKADDFVKTMGQETLRILQSGSSPTDRQAPLEDLFRRAFDLPFIGRFVLGRHWNQATPPQQAEYQKVFADFVTASYARRLAQQTVSGFQITSVRQIEDGDVLVETDIMRPNGPPLKYGWRIREVNGQLRVIDVIVENVSLVVTQRSDFSSVAQRQGMDGLIETLRKRNTQTG